MRGSLGRALREPGVDFGHARTSTRGSHLFAQCTDEGDTLSNDGMTDPPCPEVSNVWVSRPLLWTLEQTLI